MADSARSGDVPFHPRNVGLSQRCTSKIIMSHKTKPVRVQRKRTKGYRMPENTVSVTRPGKWGNPFKTSHVFGPDAQFVVVSMFQAMMLNLNAYNVDDETRAKFRYMRDRIRDLEGKNLACFCKPGTPCHADVLLKLANPA